jgi:biopolymer transport protein ExbD
MIDIVFQQLIYFLLTSSFVLHPGIQVTLPKASTSQPITTSTLVVTLTKDHAIYLDDRVVSLKELARTLTQSASGKPVLIRADRHAYVDKLIELWDLCRDAGVREVHMATLSP